MALLGVAIRNFIFILSAVMLMFGYVNCAPSFQSKELSSQAGELGANGGSLTDDQELVIEGKALYESKCASCHGIFETSLKKNADIARITNAINAEPKMLPLKSLSASQVAAVAASLNAKALPPEALACQTAPDVGSVAMHRLNQFEYRNTIKSLTGVSLAVDQDFPTEESGEFNNSAVNLKISSAQFAWYLNTAISVVENLIDTQNLRSKIYTCDLSQQTCWKNAIKTFADGAYRRPASSDEINRLNSMYQDLVEKKSASATVAIKTVFQGILISPQFLFRNVDLAMPSNSTVKQKLNGYELASRISYFIWGDMPDATLLQKATSGALDQPAALSAEVDRMLADARAADNLSENFFKYWLGLQELPNRTPSSALYPEFNEALRADMSTESRLFFRDLVSSKAPLANVLTADYSFMNQNLAQFYGIAGVTGTSFKKVSLAGTKRSGALTHGSLLTVTSHSTGTSIVRRGAFIAFNLQCINIPAPPDGVGTAPPPNGTDSVRKRLEAHRSNPQCASCHNVMDPPGFGLESYSAIGKFRNTDDEGFALDTAGVLYNGTKFSDAVELGAALSDDRSFQRCGVQKLTTFALGRTMEQYDKCTIEKIVNSAGSKSLKDVIVEVISSDPFRFERGG